MITEEKYIEICNRYGLHFSQPTHSFYIDWNFNYRNFANAVYQLLKYNRSENRIKMWPNLFINEGYIMTSDKGVIYIKSEKKLIKKLDEFMCEYKKLKVKLKESKIQEDF